MITKSFELLTEFVDNEKKKEKKKDKLEITIWAVFLPVVSLTDVSPAAHAAISKKQPAGR